MEKPWRERDIRRVYLGPISSISTAALVFSLSCLLLNNGKHIYSPTTHTYPPYFFLIQLDKESLK